MVRVHWDRLFEDLEGQLASEWESERAALDAESERLRISRLDLRRRLRVLCDGAATATIDLQGLRIRARLRALGADWMAASPLEGGDAATRTTRIIPLDAITGLGVDHGRLLASLNALGGTEAAVRERMTLGFVLRDLGRRRAAVRVFRRDRSELHGTIDRAGSDHLDLAVHDPGTARTIGAVQEFRILPFAAVSSVQIFGDHTP